MQPYCSHFGTIISSTRRIIRGLEAQRSRSDNAVRLMKLTVNPNSFYINSTYYSIRGHVTSPRILYNRSLLSGARPWRRIHHNPRRRAGIPRAPAKLLPPPSQSTYQGRRREYKASNPGSFAPSNSSAPTRFRSTVIVRPPARVQKLESTTRLPLALGMPCYQGAVTVPSSSDDSIKKIVHFKGVEVATEKSSGVFPVSYHVTTARL